MPQKLKKKLSDGDSDLEFNNDSSESTLPPTDLPLSALAGLSLLDVREIFISKFVSLISFLRIHLQPVVMVRERMNWMVLHPLQRPIVMIII